MSTKKEFWEAVERGAAIYANHPRAEVLGEVCGIKVVGSPYLQGDMLYAIDESAIMNPFMNYKFPKRVARATEAMKALIAPTRRAAKSLKELGIALLPYSKHARRVANRQRLYDSQLSRSRRRKHVRQ